MKKLVQHLLGSLAKRAIRKHQPTIIAITGSVGKTTTKEAIFHVLEGAQRSVRKSTGNLNNEFGLPLSVLGLKPARNPIGWMLVVLHAFFKSYFSGSFPEILILEMGIDHPGDMNYLTHIAPPTVAIVTGVATVHLEFFKTLPALVKEKESLLYALPREGLALVNYDNEHSREMRVRHPSLRFVSYGLSQHASVWASNIVSTFDGTTFTVHVGDRTESVSLSILGKQHILSVLPALYLAEHFNISLSHAAKSLLSFRLPPGRFTLLQGIGGSTLLDSSYNAEPSSMRAALETLHDLPAKRKVVALSDMKELGAESAKAHETLAQDIEAVAELAILVGPETQETYNTLQKRWAGRLSFFHFATSAEAAEFLKQKIKAGDLVLIKGSQAGRMEYVTKALMANPNEASKLLVRQGREWAH